MILNLPISNLKIYSLEESLDEMIGPIGTPMRDMYEVKLKKELEYYDRNKRNKR